MTRLLAHIGYHKTGTNWLQDVVFGDPATGLGWLGKKPLSHPVNRLIRERPFDFDAAAIGEAFEPLVADAEAAGLVPVLSFPRLSGHPFSGGYDSKEIADRLKQVFPDARVLVVVREQRSAVLSTYKQYVKAGGASGPREFLKPATNRGWRIPGFDFAHFAYDRLIAYYHGLYGADNVLVLPYEQFVADGRAFVEAIGTFAGRPIPGDVLDRLPYSRRSNEASAALAIELTRPLNRFDQRSDLNPAPFLRLRPLSKLAKRLRSSPLDLPGARPLAAREEAKLRAFVDETVGDRYASSNRRTAGLTGLDLAAYGWMV